MFVGVGPKRVRTLFEDAKKQAPCIIFIDEIDAVGAKRSKFSLSSSKESTLNQLLTEMDGFNQTSGIMVVGATNFPQALDKALTRPGRFDKNIVVPLPDVKGRKDIIDLYLKKTVPAPDVDIVLLAKGTPGFSGAELANLINIAAIKATVQNKPHIDMKTLEEARDDVLVGIKRMGEHTKEDRLSTAYHEGGHALVGILTDGTKPIHKATIVGRGNALGITWSLQREGESLTKKQALAELAMAMGGRAAEEIIYGEESVTTGASNDIQTATYLATQMVSRWGMSDRVGKVYYDLSANTANTSGLKISEQELTVISSEIKDIVEERYQYAKKVLKENEPALHRIAEALMEYETLSGDEIKLLAQGKPLKKEL
jgi:ATP-dependent metalloprotease FtsH